MFNTRETIRIFKVWDNFSRTEGKVVREISVLVLVKAYHGLPRRKMKKNIDESMLLASHAEGGT